LVAFRVTLTEQVRRALAEAPAVLSTFFLVAGALFFGAIVARLVQAVDAQQTVNDLPLVAAEAILVEPDSHPAVGTLDEVRRAA
jgi:hypothetical protein